MPVPYWRLHAGLLPGQLRAGVFDVKTFGAKGDGKTPDRDAINKAIEAAAAAGGGTVVFPCGNLCDRFDSPAQQSYPAIRARLHAGSSRPTRPLTMRPNPISGTSFRISDTAISTTA